MKKASKSISHKVVSEGSKQDNSQMSMDSGKNLQCSKSERQLNFRVLDRGVKENTICSMCGKKETDQEGDDDAKFDSVTFSIFGNMTSQNLKRERVTIFTTGKLV